MEFTNRLLFNNFQQISFLHNTCLLCGSSGPYAIDLCPDCNSGLPWITSQCHSCGLPLPDAADQLYCGECLAAAPPFQLAITPLYYRKPLSPLINRFKHHNGLAVGKLLGQLLAQEIRDHYVDDSLPDAIVAVPLHWQRFLWRGYNQSIELAKQLSAELGITSRNDLVKRLRKTPRQQGLSREARLRNLKNAFHVTREIPMMRIALLDDVVTTGSTASEIANLLIDAGAKEVHLWAIARTPV